MKPRLYVEGESRSLDEALAYHERMNLVDNPVFQGDENATTRPVEDPLGFKEPKPVSSIVQAQQAAVRLVKFFALLMGEFRLSPAQAIYAMELAYLNVLNTDDCPLPIEEIQKVRQLAFDYYKGQRAKVPAPAAPAKP